MSFELHAGFEKRTEIANGREFADVARMLKDMASAQGVSEEVAMDHLVRLGPVAAMVAIKGAAVKTQPSV